MCSTRLCDRLGSNKSGSCRIEIHSLQLAHIGTKKYSPNLRHPRSISPSQKCFEQFWI
ncbi:hypothetical protein HFN_1143 [Helicobacter fennelliae MRY12-0050]|uniref:Uncharacterized protein n=1 Tax=Helicobacter fennelliae MRY12-0050 TaxID=1325130 RepID=T1DWT0_9HELI|nr:hypothetical protein HFN_1143 [Helicobacter fennelliae MRY12-0050]